MNNLNFLYIKILKQFSELQENWRAPPLEHFQELNLLVIIFTSLGEIKFTAVHSSPERFLLFPFMVKIEWVFFFL